jgi:predicted regulator of Ras-like GTPase activity (Roadblock/LC7/MglB family)
MGYVRFQQGRLDEAEAHLSHAATLDPSDERNLSALAYVRQSQNGAGAQAEAETETETEMQTQTFAIPEAPVTTATQTPSQSQSQSPRHSGSTLHPSEVFNDLLAGNDQAAMLLDGDGLVLAGGYPVDNGQDIAQEVGAGLSGVSEEAERAMRHLGMGGWTSLVFETDHATLAMAPGPDGGLLVVAASRATPLGFVRRLLERVSDRARVWLGAEARP